MPRLYYCSICNSKPRQKSHHDAHIKSAKHKAQVQIFRLKLEKLSEEELINKYNSSDINSIIKKMETVVVVNNNNDNDNDNNNLLNIHISNKEALKDKIHDIHNFLRNNGGGYGMNALKVFNIIYGLKKIEENNLIDISNLKRPYCQFTHILNMAIENKDEELTELIQGEILTSIANSKIRNILFYEIPKNISASVFSYLVKEINEISEIEKATNTQLCGKIYEYFIGRDQTAISELGAYFTDRHITEFLYKEEPIILNESLLEVPSMCDPYGGSGGFTVGYLLYLKEKYQNINWETEIKKVHHFDMNEDVIKSAALEFFCITGQIPDMKSTLRYANSFTDEFSNNRYKKIFTNPPYGGDDNKKNQKQSKRDKVKKYIKEELKTITDKIKIKQRKLQLKNIENEEKNEKKIKEQSKVTLLKSSARIQAIAKKHGLKGNDKESVSLIQLMDLVDVGGTVVGVLKEGVFFDKKYKGLRECLINNFNVRKVISIPEKQFENTSTKTSVLVFDNTEEKTSVVEFSELIVEKFSKDIFEEIEGQIVCTGYSGEGKKLKPDIKSVKKKIISMTTAEEILANDTISFIGNNYIKDEIIPNDEYKLVKLSDLTEYLQNSKRQASFQDENGKFKFYTSRKKIQRCNINDYENECILIGTGGNSCIHYINDKFSCSGDTILLKSNKIKCKFLYFLLYGFFNNIREKMNGSTIKHVTKAILNNLIISIPKSPEKIQYWLEKISAPFNEKNEKQTLLKKMEQEVLDRLKFISENEECKNIKLEEIFNFKSGKFNSSDCKTVGKYPFYTGKSIQPEGYSNKYCYDGNEYIILIKDGGSGYGEYGFHIGLGNVYLGKGKCGFTCHQILLENKININIKCLYYILKLNNNNIMDLAKYSTGLGTINKTTLQNFKIKIPKNKKFITNLESKFEQIEQLKVDIQNSEIRFEQYIKELGNESIKK